MKRNHGAISDKEWYCLAKWIKECCSISTDGIFLEIGTLRGSTTQAIRSVLNSLGCSDELWTIDKERACFRLLQNIPKISCYHGLSNTFVPPKTIKFAFVDGCHCEECVYQDIFTIVSSTIKSSVMVFHDAGNQRQLGMNVHTRYHGDGKTRKYGVSEAIDRAKDSYLLDWECVEKTPPVKLGSGHPVPIRGGLQVWQRKR